MGEQTVAQMHDDHANNPSYESILEAAKQLFLERGFPATSMAAIAKRAGVVRATIYNNFDDKEAILGEIMRRYVAGYVAIPQQLREEATPDQTPAQLIEAMIRRAILWRIENGELRPLIDLSKHLPSSPWGARDDRGSPVVIRRRRRGAPDRGRGAAADAAALACALHGRAGRGRARVPHHRTAAGDASAPCSVGALTPPARGSSCAASIAARTLDSMSNGC